MKVWATDHAVERYVERVFLRSKGEALGSKRIREEALSAIRSDLSGIPVQRYKAEVRLWVKDILYVIRDGTVITVLTKETAR
jgi:hypothetical protein